MSTPAQRGTRRGRGDPWHIELSQIYEFEGRRVSVLCIFDPFSRLCLASEVQETFHGHDIVRVLERCAAVNRAPSALIVDNSAIFRHGAMALWAAQRGTRLVHADIRAPAMKGLFERLFQGVVADMKLPGRGQA